jgi:hypothetical protein
MTTQVEYALLAANSYAVKDSVTSLKNTISIPDGWGKFGDDRINNATGFTARAYTNGSEICIAYTGTTFEGSVNNVGDWLLGNITAGTGTVLAPQIVDAAKFYLDIQKANPGANITFTGHSLGGGLASLMALLSRPRALLSTGTASVMEELLPMGITVDLTKKPVFIDYQPYSSHETLVLQQPPRWRCPEDENQGKHRAERHAKSDLSWKVV